MAELDEPRLEAPQPEGPRSWPLLALVGSTGIAAASLVFAALKGSPYLDLSSLNGWLVPFAAAAFAALFSVPFSIERVLQASHPQRAEHWERAMLLWGLVAIAALVAGWLLIGAGGFAPADSLADAAGLLLVIEAGMVVLTLLFWLLSG